MTIQKPRHLHCMLELAKPLGGAANSLPDPAHCPTLAAAAGLLLAARSMHAAAGRQAHKAAAGAWGAGAHEKALWRPRLLCGQARRQVLCDGLEKRRHAAPVPSGGRKHL